MFQNVDPKEIFDRNYWLAQLRKKEWIRLLLILSLKPVRSAAKPILAAKMLEKLEFQVCANRLEAYQAWQANPGSIVTWCCASNSDIQRLIGPVASRRSCRQRREAN